MVALYGIFEMLQDTYIYLNRVTHFHFSSSINAYHTKYTISIQNMLKHIKDIPLSTMNVCIQAISITNIMIFPLSLCLSFSFSSPNLHRFVFIEFAPSHEWKSFWRRYYMHCMHTCKYEFKIYKDENMKIFISNMEICYVFLYLKKISFVVVDMYAKPNSSNCISCVW